VTGAQAITSIRYMVQDEVGNVIGLLNGTAVDQQVTYDDWGVATVSGSADNRLLFKGLLWEGTYTGLYYVRARWYDPELGRFISEDPLGISEGTNFYSFAGGDALNGSDPSGKSKLSAEWKRFKKKKFAPAIIGFGVTVIAAASGPLGWGAAFAGTVEAFGGAAAGSFLAAGVESMVSGGGASFGRIFARNMNAAGASLGAFSVIGAIPGIGGGIRSLGVNPEGGLQGYIASKNPLGGGDVGGLTLGPAALLSGKGALAQLAGHELSHTLQFIGLSLFGRGRGHQWWPYLAMGGLGILQQPCSATGSLIVAARWWEGGLCDAGR